MWTCSWWTLCKSQYYYKWISQSIIDSVSLRRYLPNHTQCKWVRHMPVDHRCQGHANKILFHAWPGDNWALFDVKKTIIWKKECSQSSEWCQGFDSGTSIADPKSCIFLSLFAKEFFKEKFIRFATYRH